MFNLTNGIICLYNKINKDVRLNQAFPEYVKKKKNSSLRFSWRSISVFTGFNVAANVSQINF